MYNIFVVLNLMPRRLTIYTQLLDCVAIPVALALSCLVLGVRYRMVHIVGVSVCLMGVGCLVWAGIEENKDMATTGTR